MFKIEKNKKYILIALYAFTVIAALILTTAIIINVHSMIRILGAFLSFLSPVIYGLIIAYLCNAIMKNFERYVFRFIRPKRLRRILSIGTTYLIVALFVLLLLARVIPQIVNNYDRLLDSLVALFDRIATIFNDTFISLQERFGFESDFRLTFETLTDFLSSANNTDTLSSLPFTLVSSLVTIFLSFFFATCILYHKESLARTLKKLIALILPHKGYRFVIKTVKRADRTFGRFFIGQIFDALIVGAVTFVALWGVHLVTGEMRYYALIAVIVGVTNVIPYFGPFIGGIPSAIIVLTDSLPMAILFVIIILIIQQIDGNIICPAILGQAVGLSSLWVIIAITLMSAIMGPLGMFVGVPIFSLLYSAVKMLVEARLRKKGLPTETAAYAHSLDTGEHPFSVPLVDADEDEANEEDVKNQGKE